MEIANVWRGVFGVDVHSDCLVSGNATVDRYKDGKQQVWQFGSFHSCTEQEVKVKGGTKLNCHFRDSQEEFREEERWLPEVTSTKEFRGFPLDLYAEFQYHPAPWKGTDPSGAAAETGAVGAREEDLPGDEEGLPSEEEADLEPAKEADEEKEREAKKKDTKIDKEFPHEDEEVVCVRLI